MTTKAYDPTNSVQVYNAIQAVYPGIRHFTPQTVAPFIPAGADPTWWCKVLRNVEHNLNIAPKPKRSRRTNCNQPYHL